MSAGGTPQASDRARDQALALAGLFQSLRLVQHIARRGLADVDDFETCIGSVLRIDADSVAEVYGDVSALASGLGVLLDQLGAGPRSRDLELTGYAARVLHLERRLASRQQVLDEIGTGIERIAGLAEAHGAASETVIGEVAALYVETVSRVGPRLMVGGEQNHLRDTRNAERVRTLLLAAIRSAVLWRQCGGSRIGLLLGRHRIARAASALLEQAAR